MKKVDTVGTGRITHHCLKCHGSWKSDNHKLVCLGCSFNNDPKLWRIQPKDKVLIKAGRCSGMIGVVENLLMKRMYSGAVGAYTARRYAQVKVNGQAMNILALRSLVKIETASPEEVDATVKALKRMAQDLS